MKNSKKNAIILECVEKALKDIYPDQKDVKKEEVEAVFNSMLREYGLSGLTSTLDTILERTLVHMGIIVVEDPEEEVEGEPEEVPETPDKSSFGEITL